MRFCLPKASSYPYPLYNGEEIVGRGISVLLVEQKLSIALRISKRLYIMDLGRIVFEGTPEDLRTDHTIRKEWLVV